MTLKFAFIASLFVSAVAHAELVVQETGKFEPIYSEDMMPCTPPTYANERTTSEFKFFACVEKISFQYTPQTCDGWWIGGTCIDSKTGEKKASHVLVIKKGGLTARGLGFQTVFDLCTLRQKEIVENSKPLEETNCKGQSLRNAVYSDDNSLLD